MLLDKEWYDVQEVHLITGYNTDVLRRKIKKGDIAKIKIEYGRYFVAKEEVKFLKAQREKIGLQTPASTIDDKVWYDVTEFCRLTGFSRHTIVDHINNGKITETTRSGRKHLIHYSELQRYIKLSEDRESKVKKLNENDDLDNYITTKDFFEKTGINSKKVTKLIRQGEITKWIKIKSIYLIHKDELIKVEKKNKKRKWLKENFVNQQDAMNSNDYPYLSGYRISEYARNNVFKGVEYFEGSCYIPKSELKFYNDVLGNSYTFSEAMSILNLGKYDLNYLLNNKFINYYKMNDYLLYLEKRDVDKIKIELENSLTIEDVASKLNIKVRTVNSYIRMLRLKLFITENKRNVLLKSSIQCIKEFREKYYLMNEVCSLYKVDDKTVKRLLHEKKVTGELVDERYYIISKSDWTKFAQTSEGIKLLHPNPEQPLDVFKKIMESYGREVKIKTNHKWYYQFAINRINKSKAKKITKVIGPLVRCYKRTILWIDDPIERLDNEQIKQITVDSRLTSEDIEIFCLFLKFLKSKTECNFTSDFSALIVRSKKKESEIYTEEEWGLICENVTDINLHLIKSRETYRYAQAWLYILLHLSVAWRRSDFYRIISPNIDLLGITNFEWFDNNQLTFEQAQVVINDLKLKNKGLNASKNHIKLKVVVVLVQAMATALIMCELHKRREGIVENTIFNQQVESYYLAKVLDKVNVNFASRKLNKSLLTYSFITAVQTGKSVIAYELQSYSRSHTTSLDKLNEVTKVYLQTTNTDGHYTELAKHLFERGFFGWQLDMILNLLFGGEEYTLENKTIAIKELNDVIPPKLVDTFSTFVHTKYDEMYDFLNELMLLSKGQLIEKLRLISEEKSPSLIENSQCFRGIESCPYKPIKNCLGCKYLLPTNYLLEIIKFRLNEVINVLECTEIFEETKRIKYTHMLFQLMSILTEFKRHFDVLDKNYIKSFIDLDNLKAKIENLEMNDKFLMY